MFTDIFVQEIQVVQSENLLGMAIVFSEVKRTLVTAVNNVELLVKRLVETMPIFVRDYF